MKFGGCQAKRAPVTVTINNLCAHMDSYISRLYMQWMILWDSWVPNAQSYHKMALFASNNDDGWLTEVSSIQ